MPIVRTEDAVPFRTSVTEAGLNATVGGEIVWGETVALKLTEPAKLLKLDAVIVDVTGVPRLPNRKLGLAAMEKTGALLAACTASPIRTQSALRPSPNATEEFVKTELTISYSEAIAAAALEVTVLNPVPGVGVTAYPWKMPPIIMSLGLDVETETDAPVLLPLPRAGRSALGSNGEFTFAPLIPNTISPLYSPP